MKKQITLVKSKYDLRLLFAVFPLGSAQQQHIDACHSKLWMGHLLSETSSAPIHNFY